MSADVVIIGAGQAGLAMSACLSGRSIDHVILERGEVAESWRRARWDSLRLLTPNWQSRLPGFRYGGDDPDGYMSTPEVVALLEHYAAAGGAPVRTGMDVTSVTRDAEGRYRVRTREGELSCRAVVLASGACSTAVVPAAASDLPATVTSLTPATYRNPSELEDGGVLVAGASATGVQLARELQRSGRQVTLAVGGHVRVPRTYRGMDIMWWLDAAGVLDERYDSDEIDDVERARKVPSFQLVGSPERATIDLNALQDEGVRIVGRCVGLRDGVAQFSGSLRNACTLADLKLGRLLDRLDEWATDAGLDDEIESPRRYAPTRVEESPPLTVPLGKQVSTVIWATGFRPDFSWLHVPVFDARGRIRHDGGVTEAAGLYLLGMPFLRRRKSTLIDGVGDDARDLAAHLESYLSGLESGPVRILTGSGQTERV